MKDINTNCCRHCEYGKYKQETRLIKPTPVFCLKVNDFKHPENLCKHFKYIV